MLQPEVGVQVVDAKLANITFLHLQTIVNEKFYFSFHG